jgi:hypothetical protein
MMNGALPAAQGDLLPLEKDEKVLELQWGEGERGREQRPNLIKLQIQRSLRWTFFDVLVSTIAMLALITLNQIE